ncbi:unnamed protein product [Arctia plantaginis]|uniref:Uncharacterized protein n=1 Tax=Arctia plantaginis TaxID=874455 RepID=A0A8S1AGN2_ARCPL|nr:unnamed protein product [Arctia plantaginis]
MNTVIRLASLLVALAACARAAPTASQHNMNLPKTDSVTQQPGNLVDKHLNLKNIASGSERRLFVMRIPCDKNDVKCSRFQYYEFDLVDATPSDTDRTRRRPGGAYY